MTGYLLLFNAIVLVGF